MVVQSSGQGADPALVDHTLIWREPAGIRTASAVALVIHGLNVNPLRMDPLAHELNSWGAATLRCTLSGHANSLPAGEARLASLRQVTYGLWREEAAAAYHVAAQQAERRNVPLVLVAFSLGALIGCAAALHSANIRFARLVLFAPALRIRRRSRILELLSRWPQLVVPSLSPAAYRANPGTPIAAYNALFAAQRDFERLVGPQAQRPDTGLCRPTRRDGVVSWTASAHRGARPDAVAASACTQGAGRQHPVPSPAYRPRERRRCCLAPDDGTNALPSRCLAGRCAHVRIRAWIAWKRAVNAESPHIPFSRLIEVTYAKRISPAACGRARLRADCPGRAL